MKRAALISALLLALMLPASARDLTWSRYNLNFSVPEGGIETVNTPTYYEQQWEDMALTVHLFTQVSDKKDKERYSSTLQRLAGDFNMYDVQPTKIKVKNFDAYAFEGIMPDGTRALLVNLVSKKSELVVQVVVNYLFGNREAVEDIVKSFAENPEHKPNKEAKKQKVQRPDKNQQKPSKEELREQEEREKQQQFDEKRRKGIIKDI